MIWRKYVHRGRGVHVPVCVLLYKVAEWVKCGIITGRFRGSAPNGGIYFTVICTPGTVRLFELNWSSHALLFVFVCIHILYCTYIKDTSTAMTAGHQRNRFSLE